MRGSPLFRALVALAAFVTLGWPLWKITHRTATALSATDELAAPARPIQLALSFTSSPRAVEVRHLGRKLWAATDPGLKVSCVLELPWPREGVDLQFLIDWLPETPLAAARIQLTDPDADEHVKSIWAQGPASEVLTFP